MCIRDRLSRAQCGLSCPQKRPWLFLRRWNSEGRDSGCASLVTMVKTAELRYRDDASKFRRLHGPRLRRVFAQREVSSGFVIVGREQPHLPIQRGLVEHNDMI